MIKLEHNTITDDFIHIASVGTSYCCTQRLKPILTLKEALELRNKTIKMAKDKGAKVSYKNKTKQALSEHYDNAEKLMTEYFQLFEEQLKFWKTHADGKTSFTFEESNALNKGYDIRNKIYSLFYNSTPLGQYLSQVEHIQDLHDRMEMRNDANGVTIYL